MRVMQIVTSPRNANSNSKKLSNYFIERLREGIPNLEIDYLDTSIETPPHITSEFIEAMYTTPFERSESMKKTLSLSDSLCARVLMSDLLVFGIPSQNFAMPSGFKAFIDHIIRIGLTYLINDDGSTTGKVNRQRVIFITTREGNPNSNDKVFSDTSALKLMLIACCNLIGMNSPSFLKTSPMELDAQDPNNDRKTLSKAYKELDSIAKKWIKSI